MSESESSPLETPSIGRRILSALIVIALVAAILWLVEWRSAAPPPPAAPVAVPGH